MSLPKVTVYVTSRDYGRFLEECLESVFSQTLQSWELLIFDDGSTDGTSEIARRYQARDPQRVRLVTHPEPRGLRACANEALDMARGEYIIRLDADDYFDENALLVLATYLDQHPDVGLVYPNWTYVGENGEFLGVENRKKVRDEAEVLDLPPHGACTMVRKRALKIIGGYEEKFEAQDGHELWMKLQRRFRMGNVRPALFFYRQHSGSMSRDEDRLLEARRQIKRRVAGMYSGPVKPRAVAIVPVKNTYPHLPNIALGPLAGKPLIDYTLDTALDCGLFSNVFVTTDDPAVVEHCNRRGDVDAFLRNIALSDVRAKLAEVATDAVTRLEQERHVYADIVAILSIHSPLRRPEHIQEAIDTLLIHEVDQVISTYEDLDLHFRHGRYGMEPLNAGMLQTLRFEREALFVGNGAVHVLWREFLRADSLYQGRLGHIVMPRDESLQIKSEEDRWLAAYQLQRRSERGSEAGSRQPAE